MNDQLNNNTKPKNIKELFKMMLEIIKKLYNAVTPKSVSNRKNKIKAKMTDPKIITIYLLIQCLGKSINKGYNFLKNNYHILNSMKCFLIMKRNHLLLLKIKK